MLTTERMLKIFGVVMVISALLLVRVFTAFGNQTKITDAIFVYQMECIRAHEPYEVGYDDAEDITKTMARVWDFGHRHILPGDKFVKVAPYIGVDYTLYAPNEYVTSEKLWDAISMATPVA